MNERFEQSIFNKITEIDKKHIGTSWDEEDLLELGKYAYNLALEDVRKEIERVQYHHWPIDKIMYFIKQAVV